jgi:hypothetical protein
LPLSGTSDAGGDGEGEGGREDAPVAKVAAYDHERIFSREVGREQLAVFAFLVFADRAHQDRDDFNVRAWICYAMGIINEDRATWEGYLVVMGRGACPGN